MFLHQIKILVTPYPTMYNLMIFDLRMIKMSIETFDTARANCCKIMELIALFHKTQL